MNRMPSRGDPAPHFEGTTGDGRRVRLEDFRGRTLVLYFYPKDDTPGCTRQACSLRDHAADLAAAGISVVGVSTQDEASHRAFASKYRLDFPLLADTTGAVGRAYGVLGGGGLGGWLRGALGWNARVTFVIDANGTVTHVIRRPDVRRHAEEVLALLA
jgi:peroxiredoxin Q/BCP